MNQTSTNRHVEEVEEEIAEAIGGFRSLPQGQGGAERSAFAQQGLHDGHHARGVETDAQVRTLA